MCVCTSGGGVVLWGPCALLLQLLAYNSSPLVYPPWPSAEGSKRFVLLTKHRPGAWYIPCFYAGPWCVNIPSSQEENRWAIRETNPGWCLTWPIW